MKHLYHTTNYVRTYMMRPVCSIHHFFAQRKLATDHREYSADMKSIIADFLNNGMHLCTIFTSITVQAVS